ncbi:C2H2-type domain-containing protein [Mycena indigotica]|uniref:C2H2-type domain-containing protein n=1 Tax=Mycena indigotica TaxID=2126181 RepID=A0A8H6WHR8_9AGAR|nr:C2H2-type domain-containing protein [Mycena indigotica]KAF7312729.1 C2H2-type domain-containing protein [Mycena indigotica]
MDVEAERAFCSNFHCCGVVHPDLHALYAHSRMTPTSYIGPQFFCSGPFSFVDSTQEDHIPPPSPIESEASSFTDSTTTTSDIDGDHVFPALPEAIQPIETSLPTVDAITAPSTSSYPLSRQFHHPISFPYPSYLRRANSFPNTFPLTSHPPSATYDGSKVQVKRYEASNARAAVTSAYLSTIGRRLSHQSRPVTPLPSPIIVTKSVKDDNQQHIVAHRPCTPPANENTDPLSGDDMDVAPSPLSADSIDIVLIDSPVHPSSTNQSPLSVAEQLSLSQPVQKVPIFLNGKEKTFVCPIPLCNKAYLNPNGLRYHLSKGKCSGEDNECLPMDDQLMLMRAEAAAKVATVGPGSRFGSSGKRVQRRTACANRKASLRNQRPFSLGTGPADVSDFDLDSLPALTPSTASDTCRSVSVSPSSSALSDL